MTAILDLTRGWTRRAWMRRLAVVWLAFICAASAPAASVYKCVDQAGRISFQELTCDGMAPGAPARPAPVPTGNGTHLFWRAKAFFGTAYLLGSIHFGASWMYPLPDVVMDALKSSKALVVEADVGKDPAGLAARAAATGLYRDGTLLSQVVPAPTWSALENIARTLGLPSAALERQKPWLASMTLTAAALQRLGYQPERGVDVYLMEQARSRMPILELESAAGQLKMMDSIPQQDQIAMLMQTLHDVRDADAHFRPLAEAWMSGDAAKLDGLLNEGFDNIVGGDRLRTLLITERNVAMEDKIAQFMRDRQVVFVVVGAGHLVGDQGLIARMKAAGYTIEQL